MHLNGGGEIVKKCHLKVKICMKWTNGLEIHVSAQNDAQTRVNKHVHYITNIFFSETA